MRWVWLGLLLIGCQTAPPQPDWTPPRPGVLSEGQKSRAAENGRQNLAVNALPGPKPTPQTPPVAPLPSRPQETRPALPVDQSPQGRPGRPFRSAISLAPAEDAPLVTSSEGNLVEATAETGVDALAGKGGTEILFVMVDLVPKGAQVIAGCDLALLVDVSGSVLHGDLTSAVDSTAEIYAQQGSGNRTWLIAFGSAAELLVDGLKSVPARAEIERLLRGSKEAGGGTSLAPGIHLASELLGKSAATGARHVVVVSDGELGDSSEAIQQAEAAWKSEGISFSAILVGKSVAGEDSLRAVADASNGQFVHAEGMAAAGHLLRKEASRARSIVLRDLRLQAQLAAGVTMRRAFLVDPTREVSTTGNSQEVVKLGDLHRGEKRRVLLELQVNPGTGRERALAWLSLHSKGPDAKERSPQVLPQVRVLNGTKKPTVNSAVDQCITLVYRMVSRR